MKNLTTASIKELFPQAPSRKYDKGQIICYQGDKPQHIFFVAGGHIRLYDIDDHGNDKIQHLIGPGNIFPMMYAFGVSEEVGSFYSSIDEVEVIAIPLRDFRQAIQTNIDFANSLTRWFLTEINQLVYRISSLEKTDSRVKVLYALKYLATDYGHEKGTWRQLNFRVTQQFIADLTGLARETVSATMHKLEQDEVIRSRKGHLEIKHSALAKLS